MVRTVTHLLTAKQDTTPTFQFLEPSESLAGTCQVHRGLFAAHTRCIERRVVGFGEVRGVDERDGHSEAAALRGLDPVEAEAIRAEGLDPDDPAVQAAIDFVRWELRLIELLE